MALIVTILPLAMAIMMFIIASRWGNPDFQASMLLVAYLATLLALDDFRVRTFAGLMTNLVALKTKLGVTLK